MGWHNRITLELFNKIKQKCSIPQKDREVAAEFGVGVTTAKHIRLSRDYKAYCERTFGKYWQTSATRDGKFPSEKRMQKNGMMALDGIDLTGATINIFIDGARR